MSRGEKFTAGGDGGCSFAPSCLACPFAKCRHDYYGEGVALAGPRPALAVEMRRDGYSVEQILDVLGRNLPIARVREWLRAAA